MESNGTYQSAGFDISTGSGTANAFPGKTRLPAPVGNGRPMVKVDPLVTRPVYDDQFRTTYRAQPIRRSGQNAAPFIPDSSNQVGNGGTYSAASLPQSTPRCQGYLRNVRLPQRYNLPVGLNARSGATASNFCRLAIRVQLPNPTVSLQLAALSRSNGTAMGAAASSHSQEMGVLTCPSLTGGAPMLEVRYGALTPDGQHIVCRRCGSTVALSNGTFAGFVQHVKTQCLGSKEVTYEPGTSIAAKRNPTVPYCAPRTVASEEATYSGATFAGPAKRAKSEFAGGQLDWTRYGTYTGFHESIVCKLCGVGSFPFFCVDGFRKHLELYHSSAIQ